MGEATLVGGTKLVGVHSPMLCQGRHCSVHNPSDHHMVTWQQHWRDDRGMMERICPHGIGHPDPDHMSYLETVLDYEEYFYEGFHGCDGCCRKPPCDEGGNPL